MFKGSFVALITPFLEDGSLDIASFRRLVSWQVEQGTEGLVIAGSTGESATLSSEELSTLLQVALEEAGGKIPILLGTGSNSTKASIEKTLQAKRLGASGCLVVFPYYNKPSFEGCAMHVQKIADCGLPTVLYHHPGRTGLLFSAEQLAALCKHPQIVGLKDCSANLDLVQEFVRLSPKPLFCGDDSLTIPFFAAGATGGISVLGNLIPKPWSFFMKACSSNRLDLARLFYRSFAPLCKALFLESNPICVKYAMSLAGLCQPHLRLPLILPQEKSRHEVERAYSLFQQEALPLLQEASTRS
jgi:4-hydroxy-tetrahydrodipicolinate synthase